MQKLIRCFFLMCEPPDVEPGDTPEVNSQKYFAIAVAEDEENIEICSTTNADEENFGVRAETAYGGQHNAFTIWGSGLLCEITSLLVRKRHEFHGSKSEKYSVQRFCASTKGTSFTLIYPEGAMFYSIVWSIANDNYYIAGPITSPPLLGSYEEDGFADIPTHIVWRLKNASSSTSSDYRYAIFGNDLMCSIYANHCNMLQQREGINSSNNEAGGLD